MVDHFIYRFIKVKKKSLLDPNGQVLHLFRLKLTDRKRDELDFSKTFYKSLRNLQFNSRTIDK